MKKVWAIFFLLTFLNAHTAFGEVLKLPFLIHHYIEHSKQDQDASIIHFFVKHYQGNADHQHKNSHNDHDKLPFKTVDGHLYSVVSIVPQNYIEISHHIKIISALKIPVCSQENYANASLKSIWQPPRFS